jgi:PAS domain S-box-containing protein
VGEKRGSDLIRKQNIHTTKANSHRIKDVPSQLEFSEESPNPVISVSAEGVILYANKAAAGLLKLSGVAVGRKAPLIWCAPIRKIYASGKSLSQEVSIGGKDYLFTAKAIKNKGCINVYGSDITSLRSSDAALRESEEKYKSLVDNIKDIIYSYTPDGKVTFISQNISALGYSVNDVIGHNLFEFVHPGDRKRVMADFNRTMRSGKIFFTSFRLMRKDGSYCFAEELSQAVRKGGKIALMSGVIRDVSEHRKMENVLKESESRWRSLVTSLPEFISLIDKKGRITFLNHYAKGFDEKNVIGTSVYQYTSKESLNKFRQKINQCFNTGRVQKGEHQAMGNLGSMRLYEDDFIPMLEGSGIKSVMVISRDVTERKKSEEEIKESEQKYRSLVENASDQIFMFDKECKMASLNNAALMLFGKKLDEVIGKPISALFPEKTAAKNLKNIKSVFKTGKGVSVEEELIFKGKKIFVSSSLNPIKDTAGKTIKVFGVVRDITDRKKAEEELTKSKLLLKAGLESPKDTIILGIDKNYNYLFFNEVHKNSMKYAYNRNVKLGMNLMDCITSRSDRLKSKINYDRALAGESHSTIEEYGDANRSYYESFYSPIRDEKNEIIGTTAFARDITDRKLAEKALLESEERFRAIFEGATDGILVADTKTKRFVFANPSLCELTGRSANELLKLSIGDIHPAKDLPYVMAQVARQIKGEITLAGNIPVLRKDKQVVFCDVNSKVMKIGERDCLVGFFRDITERKKSEQRIKESEDDIRMRAEETSALNKIIVVGNQAEDLQGLMKITLDETLRLLSFPGGGIYLGNPGESIVKLAYSKGLDAEFMKAVREIDIRKKPFSIIFLKKEVIFADDYVLYHPALAKKFSISSLASVPLFFKSEVIGALNVMSRKKHIFSESEKRLLISIGRAAGTSIVNRLADENLKSRTLELEEFSKMVVGRELRMVELKKRIEELENELKAKGTVPKSETSHNNHNNHKSEAVKKED